MKKFRLEILSPDREFFNDEVQGLTVTTLHGEMGILPDTLPMVVNLADGVIKINHEGKWMEAVTGEGFLQITPTNVNVLVLTAEWPYEIKIKSIEDEIDTLSEEMKKKQSLREYKVAKAELARQLAKLRIKRNMLD